MTTLRSSFLSLGNKRKFDYTMVTRDLEGVERIVRAVY